MGKRDTVATFRKRLGEVIARTGLTRAGFARKSNLDRSTLTQLLAEDAVRLPRAETILALARPHHVSLDWLLGLTDEGSLTADVMEQTAIEPDADAQLRRWYEEAAGFKVRYVPTGFPDQLKSGTLGEGQEIEVCSPIQLLELFAAGVGIWQGQTLRQRKRQLEQAASFVRQHYPAYRWFLFDGAERYSVPYTVFGPKRVAVYAGGFYLVFTGKDHIRAMTAHFEDLIRGAVMQPNEVASFLDKLAGECK
jgi:hypothetical protein